MCKHVQKSLYPRYVSAVYEVHLDVMVSQVFVMAHVRIRCYSVYAAVLLANADWGTWILHTECVNSGWTPWCTVSGTLWQPRPNDPARDCTVHREVLYSGNAIPPPIRLPTPAFPPLFPLEFPLYPASPLYSALPLVSTFSISSSMLLFNTNFLAFFSLSKYFYDTVVSRTETERQR